MRESRIDDYRKIDGSRDLSDSWTGLTQFTLLEEKPPDGFLWSGERLAKARSFMARALDQHWKKCQAEGVAKIVQVKSRNSIMPEDTRNLYH